MKKQSYILLSSLLLLAACSQKEEAVYGEGASYVQRTNQTLSDCSRVEVVYPERGCGLGSDPGRVQQRREHRLLHHSHDRRFHLQADRRVGELLHRTTLSTCGARFLPVPGRIRAHIVEK